MDLHGIVAPLIGAVNPFIPVTVRVSIGQAATSPNGERVPQYATPGSFTGSIAGLVLTVSAISAGQPQKGQTLTGGTTPLAAGTAITGQLTGSPGGIGTYSLNRLQDTDPVASQAITAAMVVQAQIQPITWKDLQQLEGLNLQGTRVKMYLRGEVDAIVRSQNKGGDLITVASGVNVGTWLVAQTMEQFPDWCCVACTLENGA